MRAYLTFLAAGALTPLLPAQTVQAHYAQYLITSTMSAHPELQKMGIHTASQGNDRETIIACSVPSKIGKESSPADLEVEKAGKPAVKMVTDRSFYDLALPLTDASHHPIGMIVMEMRFNGANTADDAVTKAQQITDAIEAKIPNRDALFGAGPRSQPLVLWESTPLPDITGDFDHLAVDEGNNRLYISAEVHHTIEVFDLKTGAHLQSAGGVKTPHTIIFVPEKQQLLVADGGDNSCVFLDVRDMHSVARVELEADPDAGVYDRGKHIFYVGNGGRGAKQPFSYITAISADKAKQVGRIRVEAANLEAMAIDQAKNLLYVNMRDKNQIGVVDLAKNQVVNVWSIPGMNLNTPMELDETNHRLFVAGRKPGKFFVIDSNSGKLVQTLDSVETADDMTFDPESKRIYVTGSSGVAIYYQDSPDQYSLVEEFGTNGGKTSTYDAALKRFYIVHPKTAEDMAGLQVYAVQ